jgi:diaminopimelate epimerase
VRFTKMHGAGNDFVVLDRHAAHGPLAADVVRALGDRHRGVGFDQLLTIEPPRSASAIAAYGIWNQDGSPAGQCGNGARCVAAWLHRAGAPTAFVMDSPAGPVAAEVHADGAVTVTLGRPAFDAAAVPMLGVAETRAFDLDTALGPRRFGAVSMGNPHAVTEVADVAMLDLAALGASVQARRDRFPEGVNVGAAQVLAPDAIALRVFERGVGETLACGSGACAAVVVLQRQGRVGRAVRVQLPGGDLTIEWPDDHAPVRMRGPAVFVFEGEWHG